MTIKFPRYTINKMGKEVIPGDVESALETIKERNEQVALLLSLKHNHPDDKGRTRVQQEQDRLNRSNPDSWERTRSPLRVGQKVLIPAGTPVGLGLVESYITERELEGTLIDVDRLVGGDGYGLVGRRVTEPLSKVSVELPRTEGEAQRTFTLSVPNDMYKAVPQAPADGLPIAA